MEEEYLRYRKDESARRTARLSDKEWNAIAAHIEKVAQDLNLATMWKVLYKEPGHEPINGQEIDNFERGKWDFCYSVLQVQEPREVTRLISEWKKEAASMSDCQIKHDLVGSSQRQPRLPPRYNAPTILSNVTAISVYENQASTSWVTSKLEIEKQLSSYLDDISRSYLSTALLNINSDESLAELLRTQEGTWLGILLAKEYPSIVPQFLGHAIPSPLITSPTEDHDNSFQQNSNANLKNGNFFVSPNAALSAFRENACKLLESERGTTDEFRVRYPHVSRRLAITMKNNSKLLINLSRNGVFIIPANLDHIEIHIGEHAAAGHWARRKPNQDTLFRLGRHEICRLARRH
jgi:hypothetical protein